MIYDTFMVNDEFDILECRLYELQAVPNLIHVAVEADVDHQDHPKPYHLSDNPERFAPWADRLRVVRASGLPTLAQNPDPWSREWAQREHVWTALSDAEATDTVLHGDIDEIPTEVVTRAVGAPGWPGFRVFLQRLHCFAVDWEHPGAWKGTVAGHVRDIGEFADMRSMRGFAPILPSGGWHLSWLGGQAQTLKKLGSFCHPEIADRTLAGLRRDEFMQTGYHVDGTKMLPVDVDETWPRWIVEGKCPESWYRPR